MPELRLSNSQARFLNLPHKYRAYVGGFGSGKTFSGCLDLGMFAAKHKGVPQGYFAPTYPLIRDIFYMTMAEAWEILGQSAGRNDFRVEIKDSNKEVHLFVGREPYGVIICRTMDNPANIVGFKIARALVDEIDVMREDKAEQAWNKIIARLRYRVPGEVNGIGVTTTPEGFKFAYKKFRKNRTESYGMVQASTYENREYLPPDYIDSLKESYPANLIEAYLNGEFVNLVGSTVYNQYDRKLNDSIEVDDGKGELRISMDFNVTKMAAVVFKYKTIDGVKTLHAVDEFKDLYDTADMIEHIKMRYPNRSVTVYPDASGKNRKTVGADVTDIKLLKLAGFRVKAKDVNPRVKTRINSVNAMLCNANDERKLFINSEKCPALVECIEQQIYNEKGEPDKTSGVDHMLDAFGYIVAYEHGISKPEGIKFKRVG